MKDVVEELTKYRQGYHILMDYWDCIPDDEKIKVHERLMRVGL